jgi:hypothetical protein
VKVGPAEQESPRSRISLLAAQAFALGLTTAWITVSATSIFLRSFGSDALPVTYVGAALAGITATALLTRALRTRPLSTVAVRVLAFLVALLMASWLLLWGWDATWVSFALLVMLPIVVPVGFVLIVGQAGMLLDVGVLKALYPRVIAGFALGFLTGGLLGPVLLKVIDTIDLLLAAGLAAAVFMALVARTKRTFSVELSLVADDFGPQRRPTIRSLLSNHFVRLVIAFQMLSAVESQWLDFLVNDRAAQRYTRTSELATFLSRFFAIAYGADILFLVVLAGLLLRRFGLRYGLMANPGVVLTVVVSMIAAVLLVGSESTLVFALVIASRVSDLTLSDGAARASLSAAYQAVPTRERTAAQALVEGLGVPVAIGFSGLVLLVMRATIGIGSLVLSVFTSIVVFVWAIVAVFVYRGYRSSLLENLRHRVIDPAELTVDETSGIEVIDRLLESDDEHEIRLGLEALSLSDHPEVVARLSRVATGPRSGPRVDALGRLALVDPRQAHELAVRGLDDVNAEVRAGSLRALSVVGGADDIVVVSAMTADIDDAVAIAAFSALSRIGDQQTLLGVAAKISTLSLDGCAARRVLAARILAECGPVDGIDRRPLRSLLADPDADVVNAALSAVGEADDDLLELVVRLLENPRTAGSAVDALVRGGDVALALFDEGLGSGSDLDQRAQELLARVCRQRGGEEAARVLRRHVGHPDREVGLAVMTALVALGPAARPTSDSARSTTPVVHDEIEPGALVRGELEYAAPVVHLLGIVPPSTALHLALLDEFTMSRHRVLASLALRYGSEGIGRVAFQLALNDSRMHALALEWLDVTLLAPDKLAIALVDPSLSSEARMRSISRVAPVTIVTLTEAVMDIIENRHDRWQSPWLISCAWLTAADMPELDFEALIKHISNGDRPAKSYDVSGLVPETVADIRRRRGS